MAERFARSLAALDLWIYATLVGLVAFIVYLQTLAPTVMWYDMGEFATVSHVLGIAHNTGYPLYILLGKLFTFLPVGDVAYRVNLMSAVFASLTAAFIFLIIHELTRNRAAALIGAFTIAFSSTLWANANWAESYSLNAFSTVLITWLLLRWRTSGHVWHLYAAFLALGLSLGNHRLVVLLTPGFLLFLWAGRSNLNIAHWARFALLFLLGLSVYLYLPIRGSQEPALSWAQPANFSTYWSMFLTGSSRGEYWNFAFLGRLDMPMAFTLHELTAAGLALAAVGLVGAFNRDRLFTAYSLLLVILTGFVVLTYSIHNVFNYFIPAYLMLGIWIGCGADAVLSLASRQPGVWPFAVIRPRLRWGLAVLILAALPLILFARNLPAVDRSEDYSAYDFARTTLERVRPDSTIITDSWTASPFWYLQLVEDYRRDVFVSPVFSAPDEDVSDFMAQQFGKGRPVYIAEGLRGDLNAVRDEYYIQPVLLNGIESMVTRGLPKPEAKDDLVPSGSFYRVLQDQPTMSVAEVPASARVGVAFGDVLSLVGFSTEPDAVRRGDVVRLSYYWRLEAPTTSNLQASVFFTDGNEAVRLKRGFPLWWQTWELGGGLDPTNQWTVGEIVKEEYFVLVPRTLAAGVYGVRVRVHDGTEELQNSSAGSKDAGQSRLVGGVIHVE